MARSSFRPTLKAPERPAGGLRILALAAIALALVPASGLAMTGDRLDRSRLVSTFSERFTALDLYDAAKNPRGRWKTSYDFGWPANASSRTLDGEYEVYSDKAYNGVDPFRLLKTGLAIIAAKDAAPSDPRNGGKAYTSGLLTTSASFSQRYGYFEMQASLPAVPGAWPAFWLNAPFDPKVTTAQHNGEIDVMEFLGGDPSRIYCSLHWPDGRGGYPFSTDQVLVSDETRPHAYGVLWTADAIVWYVDGVEVNRRPNPGLHTPMIMLLNLAAGGWNNNVPPPSAPSMRMLVYRVDAYRIR